MGDAGGQFAERGQLLAHDDLVLRLLQVAQRGLELVVLALEFLGELLHQVQPLDFEGVAAEDLERRGHLADLVAPADIDLGLQVAFGHAAHAVRQAAEPPREEAADIDPGQQHGADHADGADQQQEVAPGQDRLGRGEGGFPHADAGGPDQPFGRGHELDGKAAVAFQEIALPAVDGEFPGAQAEDVVRPFAQRDQPAERLGEPRAEGAVAEPGQAPLDPPRGRLEALPQRLQQRGVGHVQRRRQNLGAGGGVGAQFRKVAVPGDRRLGKMLAGRRRRLAELAIAGHGVEQLIVDQRNQAADQPAAQRRHFPEPRLVSFGQFEAHGHRGFDRLDIGHQGFAAPAQGFGARRIALGAGQRLELRFEGPPVVGDAAGDPGQLAGRGGGGQARRGGDQRAALLGDGECSGHFRYAALVHPALYVADAVEGNPPDQAGDDREEDGAPDPEVELSRQASGKESHRAAGSRSVSTAR